jgi:hypothetical protein
MNRANRGILSVQSPPGLIPLTKKASAAKRGEAKSDDQSGPNQTSELNRTEPATFCLSASA